MINEYTNWESKDVRVQVEKAGSQRVIVFMKKEHGGEELKYDSVLKPDWKWMEQVHQALWVEMLMVMV